MMRMTKICLADSILEKFDGSDDCVQLFSHYCTDVEI